MLKILFRKLLVVLILMVIAIIGYAQDEADHGFRTEVTIEKRLGKKFAIDLEEELRFNQNISRFDLINSSLGASYQPVKPLKFALSYRFTAKHTLNEEYSFRHRLALDVFFRYDVLDFRFIYRNRIQSELKNYLSSTLGKSPAWQWRNKFTLKYSFKDISPYLGAEFYYQIKDARNPLLDRNWFRHRIFAGIDYKIKKRNELGIFILIQRGVDYDDPRDLNVLGLKYSLTLPRKK
jgi:hypothetical protein